MSGRGRRTSKAGGERAQLRPEVVEVIRVPRPGVRELLADLLLELLDERRRSGTKEPSNKQSRRT